MEEMQESVDEFEITSNDQMWAALSWIPVSPLYPILAIVALMMEDTKDRPFVRYNAVLAIATGAILIPLSFITCGLAALTFFVFFYWAYQAYQGQTVEIPVVSDWIRGQGWA